MTLNEKHIYVVLTSWSVCSCYWCPASQWGALFGGMTGSEFTEEGGWNEMRSDRATQRRSLAWVWPPCWCRTLLHIPTLGWDAFRGLLLSIWSLLTAEPRDQPQSVMWGFGPPSSLNVSRVLHLNPAEIRGVQMKMWGGGGEQMEEKWNVVLLPGLRLSGAYRLRWVKNGHCPPSGPPAVVNK